MRILLFFFFTAFLLGNCLAQDDLRSLVLNKKKRIPSDWMERLQQMGTWEYQQTMAVKRKRVKESYLRELGMYWNFQESHVQVDPYFTKINNEPYGHMMVRYYEAGGTFSLETTVDYGKRSGPWKASYKLINLTDQYLVLEKIDHTFCYDVEKGEPLSKRACKEKWKERRGDRPFGGKAINIGKVPKLRLVFRLQETKQ